MLAEKTFQDLKKVVDADGISICQFLNRYYSKISPYIPITSIHVEDVDRLLHACQTLELKSVKVLKKEYNIVTSTETSDGTGPLACFLENSLFEPVTLQEKLASMSETELKTNLWLDPNFTQPKKNLENLPEGNVIANLIQSRFTILREKNYPMFPSIMDLLIAKWIQTKEISKEEAKQMESFIFTNCFLPPSHVQNLSSPAAMEQVHAYYTQDLSLNVGVLSANSSIPITKRCPSLLPWNKWVIDNSGDAAKKMKNWMTIDYRSVLYRLSKLDEMKDKVSGLVIGYTLPHLFTRLTPFIACSRFGHLTKNNSHVTMMFASVISEIFHRRVVILSSTNTGAFCACGSYTGSSGGYSGSVLVDFSSPELDNSTASQVDFSHSDTTFAESRTLKKYTFNKSTNVWDIVTENSAYEESVSGKVLRTLRLMYQGNPLSPDSCIDGAFLMAFPNAEAIQRIHYAFASPYLHCSSLNEVLRSSCVNNAFILTNSLARILKNHVIKHIDANQNYFKPSENVTSLVSGCYPYIFFSPYENVFGSATKYCNGKNLPSSVMFRVDGLKRCCESTYQGSSKAAFFFTTLLSYAWCKNHSNEVEKIKNEFKKTVLQTLIQPKYLKQAQDRFSVELISAHQLKVSYLKDMEKNIKCEARRLERHYSPMLPKDNGTAAFMIVIPLEQLTNFLCESYLYYDEQSDDDTLVKSFGYEENEDVSITGWNPRAVESPDVQTRREKTEPLIPFQELDGTEKDYLVCNLSLKKVSEE